jgi:hypothetical protein
VGKFGMGKIRAVVLTAMISFSFLTALAVSSASASAETRSAQAGVVGSAPRYFGSHYSASAVSVHQASASQVSNGYGQQLLAPRATPDSGPEITTQSEADAAQNRRKIVAGVAAVVLLGLVIWGRHIRKKRNKVAS